MTNEYFEPLSVLKTSNDFVNRKNSRTTNTTPLHLSMIEKVKEPPELRLHQCSDLNIKASNTESNIMQGSESSIKSKNTVYSLPRKIDTLITVQHDNNDTVSNFTSSVSTRRTFSNCNNTFTKTNAIKPNQISRSIRDIQGMLVSNLNSKSTGCNKSCDANSNLNELIHENESLNTSPSRNYSLQNINTKDNDISNVKRIELRVDNSGVTHDHKIYDLDKPELSNYQRLMLSHNDMGVPEKSSIENGSHNDCFEKCFPGDNHSFVFRPSVYVKSINF